MGTSLSDGIYTVGPIEKGMRIEYPYNFGLPLGNSAFVSIWPKIL